MRQGLCAFRYDDGGRAEAGFKGYAGGDCAVRAVGIATRMPCEEVERLIFSHLD